MKYTTLGNTGIQISRISLGMASYGDESLNWNLDLEAAKSIIEKAVDLGINYFDTADVYGAGGSEIITGKTLNEYREDVIIGTKVRFSRDPGPNKSGLNRLYLQKAVDQSLERLNTDHIDLYQIHRMDTSTSSDVMMRSLNQLIDQGKVLHIGASSMPSWQFSKVNATAKNLGLEGFSTMQLHHNPLYREEEREMLDLCAADNIATLAWSPLARGLVAKAPENTSLRVETDQYREWYSRENDVQIIGIINQIAIENEITMAQVSLSWQINRIGITSPIIGATRISHLEEAVAAVEINLNEDYYKRLEEVYTPRFVIGH